MLFFFPPLQHLAKSRTNSRRSGCKRPSLQSRDASVWMDDDSKYTAKATWELLKARTWNVPKQARMLFVRTEDKKKRGNEMRPPSFLASRRMSGRRNCSHVTSLSAAYNDVSSSDSFWVSTRHYEDSSKLYGPPWMKAYTCLLQLNCTVGITYEWGYVGTEARLLKNRVAVQIFMNHSVYDKPMFSFIICISTVWCILVLL